MKGIISPIIFVLIIAGLGTGLAYTTGNLNPVIQQVNTATGTQLIPEFTSQEAPIVVTETITETVTVVEQVEVEPDLAVIDNVGECTTLANIMGMGSSAFSIVSDNACENMAEETCDDVIQALIGFDFKDSCCIWTCGTVTVG